MADNFSIGEGARGILNELGLIPLSDEQYLNYSDGSKISFVHAQEPPVRPDYRETYVIFRFDPNTKQWTGKAFWEAEFWEEQQ